MTLYLQDKVAVVTGVSSGLGRGVAKTFAALGAQVVGLARRADKGAELQAEIEAADGRFDFAACDITDPAQCQDAVAGAIARHGHIDILINNAATSGDKPVQPIEAMTEADWDAVFATNLRAAFTMTRLVLPSMRVGKGGVILNIASINAVIGVANMAAYNASKAGLVHFTNTTAVENAAHGVRAIAIVMGGVQSEMGQRVSGAMGRSMRGVDWRPPEQALSYAPPAEEYGRALAVLCSDDARLITGATIALDGGASAGAIASRMIYLGASQDA
jgi:NAD(P)-dependent dehydrogenase (short-subunit alcohol dehydrogenase family)